jgi:CBS domain containing-hemolysin-like protein
LTDGGTELDLFGVAWRLGATLFFVGLNGFFVAAEFALVKVRESRIEQLAREGRRAAPGVQHILRHLDRYLSSCQLGITLASLILGALGEPAVSVLVVAAAGAAGVPIAPDSTWLHVGSLLLAFTVITALHMTIGEQAPKMWALRRPEAMALAAGPTLRAFTFMFGPFITAIHWLSNALLRMVGVPGDLGQESSLSAEEIRSVMSLSVRSGHISEHEYQLTENVFRMIELEVRHIVVPRVEVAFLTLEHSVLDNLDRLRTTRHSRLALCEVGLDTIIGFVHAKDVLDAALRGETPDLRSIARAPIFVPDTMPLSNFLRELQATRQHCAGVVDEHGTVIGLAFREDALEEIVGPLGDEFDAEEPRLTALANGAFELPGRMPLPEVEDRLDLQLTDDEYEDQDTIGGHVTARLGRLPRNGDAVRVGRFHATVIDASRRRVQRLRLDPLSLEEDAPGEEMETGADAERGLGTKQRIAEAAS